MPEKPDRQAHQEHPSTYVVRDRTSEAELLRLDAQDRLFTEGMGGVLSEQPDPTRFRSVLDVGCGPGWWLTQTAHTYPTIAHLVGLDVSSHMIRAACQQAETMGVSHRVHFQTGDALRLLEFGDQSFDLVNQRFGMSYLRTWDWEKLLIEYQRVCTFRGVIRITEAALPISNSPTLELLQALLLDALLAAGHFFSPDRAGVTDHLAAKMRQHGIQDVQTRQYTLTYGAKHLAYLADVRLGFQTLVPFLRKWTKVPGDYAERYDQMCREIAHSDFTATITLLTAWGTPYRPSYHFPPQRSVQYV